MGQGKGHNKVREKKENKRNTICLKWNFYQIKVFYYEGRWKTTYTSPPLDTCQNKGNVLHDKGPYFVSYHFI